MQRCRHGWSPIDVIHLYSAGAGAGGGRSSPRIGDEAAVVGKLRGLLEMALSTRSGSRITAGRYQLCLPRSAMQIKQEGG